MSTVAPSVRGAKATSPTAKPPVRHGKCRLEITINGDIYTIRRHESGSHARLWRLKKRTGARSGRILLCGRIYAQPACDCEDWNQNRPRGGCKHLKALRACGLIAGKTRRSRSQLPAGTRPCVLQLLAAPVAQAKGGSECPF